MEQLESPNEIIPELVAKVEDMVPELVAKVEDMVPELVAKVEEVASTIKKADVLANEVLNKLVERVPQAAKVVDEALAKSSYSCGVFRWLLSASRPHRSPAKLEAPLSEVPK